MELNNKNNMDTINVNEKQFYYINIDDKSCIDNQYEVLKTFDKDDKVKLLNKFDLFKKNNLINLPKFNMLDFKYKFDELSNKLGSDNLILFLSEYDEYLKLVNSLQNEYTDKKILYDDISFLVNEIKSNNDKIISLINKDESLVVKHYIEIINLYYTNYSKNLDSVLNTLSSRLEDNKRELENINRLKLF